MRFSIKYLYCFFLIVACESRNIENPENPLDQETALSDSQEATAILAEPDSPDIVEETEIAEQDNDQIMSEEPKEIVPFDEQQSQVTVKSSNQDPGMNKINFSMTGISSANLNWTSDNSSSYLLIASEGEDLNYRPVNGFAYQQGHHHESHKVIYVGSEISILHEGLINGSSYSYGLFSIDANLNYSQVATLTIQVPKEVCGTSDDRCYDDDAAMNGGFAITPSGKVIEYVYANGLSNLKVWKEFGGNRLLRANGLDQWARSLNLNGKGFSQNDFIDLQLGTELTMIVGRACPSSVYINESNKFTVGNCLYFTHEFYTSLNAAGTSQTSLDVMGLNEWDNYNFGRAKWYVGNIGTCARVGMRLPTLFETTASNPNSNYLPFNDGTPVFAQANGVPSRSGWTFTATSTTNNNNRYWIWSGAGSDWDYYNAYYHNKYVTCVLP